MTTEINVWVGKWSSYNLWIDDQLDDPNQDWRRVPDGYFGAKSVAEACAIVSALGPPKFMDLDCDLGEGGRVIDFLKFLEMSYPNNPPEWKVHSKNQIAAEAVNSFMKSWHRVVLLALPIGALDDGV